MKKEFQGLASAVLMTLSVSAGAANLFDANGNPIPAAMDNEQARLNQLNRRADEVIEAHGRYMLVRDNYFYGTTGINNLSNAWFTDATAWLNAMGLIVQQLSTNVASLSTLNGRVTLQTQVSSAYTNYVKLRDSANRVQTKCYEALAEMQNIRRFPGNFITDYGPHTDLLVGEVNKLEASITDIKNSLDAALVANSQYALSKTKEVSDILIKNAALQAPDLQLALADVAKMYLAEQVVTPLRQEIFNLRLQIASLKIKRRTFTANDLLTQMTSKVAAAIVIINQSAMADADKLNAATDLNGLVAQATNDVKYLMAYAKTNVYRFYLDTQNQIAPLCQVATYQLQYNCQLLRGLIGLDSTSFTAMTMGDLKLMETSLTEVYSGPTGGLN
ncbi:MAG: hypothetical protein HY273_15340 [Gammaproteobacteria bacterium]|nr:hypothetical protein [Gammaproteobacteria bacterium]